MKNNARKLMLCRDSHHGRREDFPYVLIKGKWFKHYGFSPGDQIVVTSPKPGTLLITVHKTAFEMDKERNKKKQEIDAFAKRL